MNLILFIYSDSSGRLLQYMQESTVDTSCSKCSWSPVSISILLHHEDINQKKFEGEIFCHKSESINASILVLQQLPLWATLHCSSNQSQKVSKGYFYFLSGVSTETVKHETALSLFEDVGINIDIGHTFYSWRTEKLKNRFWLLALLRDLDLLLDLQRYTLYLNMG